MKIAVCSSDGRHVDLHFGKTTVFHIYRIDNGVKAFIGKRETEAYSPSAEFLKDSDASHEFDSGKFEKAYAAISDCQKLYTADIGKEPADRLKEKGMEIQLCNCPVDMIPACSGNCKP